ncbi:hypothetical protein B0H17DRAFT_1147804 [Mycena rosella]|uniref:Uncharacterized protein n=1 Tax=Mycena rosella TaxID=1033263 RepID=A0AAD7CHE4_MYCRO|nr:hypothetical protein B0H17DRAFT_1147804 [Mycena rosella]
MKPTFIVNVYSVPNSIHGGGIYGVDLLPEYFQQFCCCLARDVIDDVMVINSACGVLLNILNIPAFQLLNQCIQKSLEGPRSKESELLILYPKQKNGPALEGKSGSHVHVTVYREARRPALHVLCWMPGVYFDLGAYDVEEWREAQFLRFCVGTSKYEAAKGPVNMIGRGKYMIYLKKGVHYSDCHRLGTWEERACESADADARTVASSSGVEYSSSPDRLEAPPPNAVASSSKIAFASSSKRKAEVALESIAKKVKTHVPGSLHNPISVPSSDPDADTAEADTDSDVEIVAVKESWDCVVAEQLIWYTATYLDTRSRIADKIKQPRINGEIPTNDKHEE